MFNKLMRLQVQFRVKDHEFLLQALAIQTREVLFTEMLLQAIVVHKVPRVVATSPAIADMTSLVPVTAMRIQLVIAVKPLPTEPTLWMTFEAALIYGARVVVAELFVPAKISGCEQLMLVGEDLLVAGTEVAHHFVVHTFDVAV